MEHNTKTYYYIHTTSIALFLQEGVSSDHPYYPPPDPNPDQDLSANPTAADSIHVHPYYTPRSIFSCCSLTLSSSRPRRNRPTHNITIGIVGGGPGASPPSNAHPSSWGRILSPAEPRVYVIVSPHAFHGRTEALCHTQSMTPQTWAYVPDVRQCLQ